MDKNALSTEWCLLQNQYDSYEKHSLYIKLVSILVVTATLLTDQTSLFVILLLAVLWLQDAIWKTFQARIEPRLLQLEQYIADDATKPPCQFNSHYQQSALTGLTLITEYLHQAVRPTIAFPYLILIAMLLVQTGLA